ncbi:hypothetical protein NC652_012999 [Populus alba x Populus x berolinensis]|uniref:Uncharacterized protein n=1 Tax=Populus alba x Populus x berolinensis TaxID=444605 RepID=A0AAD6QTA9_9ROSI|nr:hypothetical protein NC652_012999 [Populus alba x Populus x berolinensis]KAJ6996222.1 hypothetical protein NC653_012966 [Populus alba x Populus x berolinensis]KAJ6996225.1 hypothetical protein NC653_012969 [Populus alba x Populus x berolinensis]
MVGFVPTFDEVSFFSAAERRMVGQCSLYRPLDLDPQHPEVFNSTEPSMAS